MNQRRILAVMSDPHGGSQLGLLNPATVLEREDENGNMERWQPNPTATQRYLWDCYEADRANIVEMAGHDEIILLCLGDLTQGVRYPSLFVSNRIADQFIIAADCLEPWFSHENVRIIRLAKGTGSHVFGEGSAEVLVAHMLKNKHPGRDIQSCYHGLLDIDGVTIDYAHHGAGPGIREWTAGNQCRYYLKSLIHSEWKAGREPPRLVLRGHYHTYRREKVFEDLACETREFDMVLMPSYCGMGDHGHQATRSAWLQTHGMVAFELSCGQIVDAHAFTRTLDLRTKEAL